MKRRFLPFTTFILAAMTMAGCGGSTPEEPIRPIAAFALGEKTSSGMDYYTSHQINFYKQNVYEYVTTKITYGYSMNLGTEVTARYGTYVAGYSEDGISEYTLNKAAEVVLSSFSLAGGFKLQVNTTDPNQEYPAELPAQTQGEKRYANSKDDVINAYGLGTKIYVENNVISFNDPNASEGAEKAVVTTVSQSVSSVLNKNFKKVQVTSEIKAGAVGDLYTVYYMHVFDDNSYEYITTGINFGYNMVLGTTNTVSYGKGSFGAGEDGFTPFTLEKGNDVVLNSYSRAGGFSIAINTSDSNQEYPAELPAQTQGEKRYANSKDDVINEYAPALTVYTSDADCVMSLVNPNA